MGIHPNLQRPVRTTFCVPDVIRLPCAVIEYESHFLLLRDGVNLLRDIAQANIEVIYFEGHTHTRGRHSTLSEKGRLVDQGVVYSPPEAVDTNNFAVRALALTLLTHVLKDSTDPPHSVVCTGPQDLYCGLECVTIQWFTSEADLPSSQIAKSTESYGKAHR